jgi:6,7-dimethyl-8-ribityllumazine synthase
MAEEAAGETFSGADRDLLGRLEFAICVGTFYEELAERLLNGAVEGFDDGGVSAASVDTYEVPGAFELPLAAKWCAESGRFAGVACLGAVIRGETDHYDYVCGEAGSAYSPARRWSRPWCARRATSAIRVSAPPTRWCAWRC